jgi:hypothetical protein
MSAEGHFPGSTTNAHTRGPVLSLVTNWGEVLHQSVKLKLQHDKTINQLFASNETSLLLKLQPPTNSEKCGDFAHGFLRTGEVAANLSSIAPVEPAVPASNKDRTVFFFKSQYGQYLFRYRRIVSRVCFRFLWRAWKAMSQ